MREKAIIGQGTIETIFLVLPPPIHQVGVLIIKFSVVRS